SLQQLIKEQLNPSLNCLTIPQLDHIGLLFLLPEKTGIRQVAGKLNQLFLPARRLLGLRLSVGLGHTYQEQDKISNSYDEAVNALEYQVLVGPEQCIYIGDIEPEAFDTAAKDSPFREEIIRQIKIGTKEDLQIAIEKLVEYFTKTKITLPQYQVFLLEMSAELLKLIRTYRLDEQQPFIQMPLLEKGGQSFSNLQAMGEWLLDYSDNLRRLIRHERKTTTKQLVDRAEEYLAEHFQNGELSVEVLSNELNVSPAYFSTLFKKETGLNFVSYLTKLRLEKALEYLHNTDEKSYIIAEKVGYADPNYFSYVFKKEYGVSPSKYRLNRDKAYEKAQGAI
ncbi:MAG: helix-turn-helix domain-containing protein, partial [Clostridiales bacterium]|nr:helix-turn-helix domain-containing protein [Clostridiales bacterium]